MLRLPSFRYEPAFSVSEAVALLDEHGDDGLPVSGGTDLYPNMKQGLTTARVLIGLRTAAELRFINYDRARGLEIGALTTLSAIAASPHVIAHYPALARAAALVGTPEIRSMGTIGGNLSLDTRCNYYNQSSGWRKAVGCCLKREGDVCRVAEHSARCLAVNSSDTAPVLQAFDAAITLAGPSGQRTVPLAQYYCDDGRNPTLRRSSEIVTRVTLRPPRPYTRSSYHKLRFRGSFDFPVLGVAVVAQLDPDGICRDARMVLGAVAPRPLDVRDAAQRLIGTRLDRGAIAEAAELAFKAGKPMDNTSGSLLYRKRMLRVFSQRALEEIGT